MKKLFYTILISCSCLLFAQHSKAQVDLYPFLIDADFDGYGDDNGGLAYFDVPFAPPGYSQFGGDCNDNNAFINPAALEICDGIDNNCNGLTDTAEFEICDGYDNNCNGLVDEGYSPWTFYIDNDADGYGTGDPVVSCDSIFLESIYWSQTSGDCNDSDPTVHPGATELCDNKDNNCDGMVNEGFNPDTFYVDTDLDGFGAGDPIITCDPSAYPAPQYATIDGDCDNTRADINPWMFELCDGDDNDCDGEVDEGIMYTVYRDFDMDGFGSNTDSLVTCETAFPVGYRYNSGDCDDNNAAVNPWMFELCDGLDNDCDGEIDEGIMFNVYRDVDGDGYGNDEDTLVTCDDINIPSGYDYNGGDCDDTNPAVHPFADELCDGYDNDCDGQTDEGFTVSTYYADADNDGLGNRNAVETACIQPPGYVTNDDDCDDGNAAITTSVTASVVPGGNVSICKNSTLALSASPSGSGYAYQWYRVNNMPIGGATSATYTATAPGKYYVVLTSSGGCTAVSPITTLKPKKCTREDEQTQDHSASALQAYPNPTDGTLIVTFEADANVSYALEVLDATGRIMSRIDGTGDASGNNVEVSLRELAAGMYFIRLIDGSNDQRVSIIKQ